jgi:hypothetical protein
MLSKGPEELYEVDTLRKPALFQISVTDLELPHHVTKAMACTVCRNIESLNANQAEGSDDAVPSQNCNDHNISSASEGDTITFSHWVTGAEDHPSNARYPSAQ